MIEFSYTHLLFGIAILAIVLIYFVKQKRSFWYLVFFSVFWIYLLCVVSVVAFPIAPLPEKYSANFRPQVNLIPLSFGMCDMPWLCFREIVGNILLTTPFGFGASFIARLRFQDFLWLGPFVGMAFEVAQLVVSLVFRSAFRTADINDVLLNATGVWLGYFLFRIFGRLYIYITQRFKINNQYIFAHIYDVVCQS